MPDEIIKWGTGICPLIYHVELVLKQIVSIFEEVQNILLFNTPRTVISTDADPLWIWLEKEKQNSRNKNKFCQ